MNLSSISSTRRARALFLIGSALAAGLTVFACSSDDTTAGPTPSGSDASADATTARDTGSNVDTDSSTNLPDASKNDAAKSDAGTDAAADASDAGLQTLQFWSPCVKADGGPGKEADLAPATGEDNFLVGVRLTPNSYPFTVQKIRYAVANGGSSCRPDMAHKVEVSVGTGTMPANSPTLAETINVPGVQADAGPFDAGAPDSGAPKRIWLEHTLTTPIQLTTGQHLFVAVQLAGVPDQQTLCTSFCFENTIADRNFWSQAATTPYNWVTLDGIGFPINSEVEALGLPQ